LYKIHKKIIFNNNRQTIFFVT